jgi:hypothetical protein
MGMHVSQKKSPTEYVDLSQQQLHNLIPGPFARFGKYSLASIRDKPCIWSIPNTHLTIKYIILGNLASFSKKQQML